MSRGGHHQGRGGHQRDDRENFELRIPPGWEDCPKFGEPIKTLGDHIFRVIPSKVPLAHYYNRVLRDPQRNQYTLRDAVDEVEARYHLKVGMVLDLTNSNRYYDFHKEFPDAMKRELSYVKVRCRGRGESPTPEAVNQAVWELYKLWSWNAELAVFMHCTHGFNRTGYIIACAMVRLAADKGMSVDRAVRRFADARSPGIYKDNYINDLFKYHHETRGPHIVTPHVPGWKGVNDDEDDGDEVPPPVSPPPKEIHHERIEDIGEPVPHDEAIFLQGVVYQMLTGQELRENQRPHFPGSQPVSLARANLDLILHQRYWVSWKADGTRYLLLLEDRGCYLIDRSYKVVRLQMRFPTPAKLPPPAPGEPIKAEYPVGKPHTGTLMDGEMVVDDDQGKKYRRYLAYDLPFLNGVSQLMVPWEKRFKTLESNVIAPRNKEKSYILGQLNPQKERYRAVPLGYDYTLEPFSVRRKDFWPLWLSHRVIQMIPTLSHEADGLILQSAESAYVANTDNALLKFKFAHLNSVDFKLTVAGPPENPEYTLWLIDSSGPRRRGPGGPSLKSIPTGVEFPDDIHGPSLDGTIIECTWNATTQRWRYLRKREDKNTPNAYHVYQKVMISITDDIRGEELVGYLQSVFWHTQIYEQDREAIPDEKRPRELPPPLPTTQNPQHQHHQLHDEGEHLPLPPPQEHAWEGQQYPQGENQHGQGDPPPPPEAPWTPPYYGPDPTPPRDESQPLDPTIWPYHEHKEYPFHILPPPPPPPLEQPPSGDEHDGHQQHHNGHEGGVQPHVPPNHPEPDVNPYYTEPHEVQGYDNNGASGGHQHQPVHHAAVRDNHLQTHDTNGGSGGGARDGVLLDGGSSGGTAIKVKRERVGGNGNGGGGGAPKPIKKRTATKVDYHDDFGLDDV